MFSKPGSAVKSDSFTPMSNDGIRGLFRWRRESQRTMSNDRVLFWVPTVTRISPDNPKICLRHRDPSLYTKTMGTTNLGNPATT